MENTAQILETARKTIEIEAQALADLKAILDANFVAAVQAIHQSKGRVVITGVGKSALIATKIVATLNSTGTPAIFMHAADAVHGDLGIIQKEDVVLCISKSGNTEEIKVLVPLILRAGNTLVGFTAEKSSFLGQSSSICLITPVAQEACPNNLAPTTSTTVQLALGDALAMCLLDLKNFDAKDFAQYHPGGSLGKQLYLKVGDLLVHHEAPKVGLQSSVQEVIHEITAKRLGATAVLDNDKIVGIITDGDLRRMLNTEIAFDTTTAKDIMTSAPKTLVKEFLAIEALRMMEKQKINHYIVVDAKGRYSGIVHILDFLREGIRS